MSVSVYKAMEGKTIFFTGVTGFVGKVFLYKILREFPNIKNVYCLVRTMKGQTPLQRFENTVLKSECYTPLKKEIGDEEFKRRVAKVTPMSGDMMEDDLGLSLEDYTKLCQTTNYIVHMAATVDFQERLDVSVKMNVLGTLRVVAVARKCCNLEAMIHTSTCYVNWNRASGEVPVKEEIYPLPFDAEDMCKYILSIHPFHIASESKKLLAMYNFPNTYTFTKSMCERILNKTKGNLPLTIVRPSIIGCAWRYPCPGWIDVLTAAGAIIITAGIGILKDLHAESSYVADIVPVDYVCNSLILAVVKTSLYHKGLTSNIETKFKAPVAAHTALALPAKGDDVDLNIVSLQHPGGTVANVSETGSDSALATKVSMNPMPFVFQTCTSGSQNRLLWQTMVDAISHFWSDDIPHPKAVAPVKCVLTPSRAEYVARLWMYRKIPLYVMKALVKLPPPIGSPEKEKLLNKYAKAVRRTEMLNFQFNPFTTYQWLFDNANSKYLADHLDEESAKNFNTDVFDIHWWSYCELYSWGMTKFIMKAANREQPVIHTSGSQLFTRAKM
eukprot:Tbor_TRINITY_DN2447_c0_g1::TRINITY_DN2447_c0_g1_i1::g.2607::m.2607/K13356/FAR; alcohol-forming fatty acyl-CoA reductase